MNLPDFRPQLHQAQDWVATLIAETTPEQLDRPTPCEEFDVRDLIAHVYKGTMRIEAMGKGIAAETVDFRTQELPDDLLGGFQDRVAAGRQVWADDAALSRTVTAPWGKTPGALAIGGYLTEALAHGWDLAIATGRPSEIDSTLAEAALQVAQLAIPAEGRDQMPFGEVVPCSADASPSDRFVAWMGRKVAQPAEVG